MLGGRPSLVLQWDQAHATIRFLALTCGIACVIVSVMENDFKIKAVDRHWRRSEFGRFITLEALRACAIRYGVPSCPDCGCPSHGLCDDCWRERGIGD